MPKPKLPALFRIKGNPPEPRLSVRWGRGEGDGYCNVCTPAEQPASGRWVMIINVRSVQTHLCINHANALHAQMGALLAPLKLEEK